MNLQTIIATAPTPVLATGAVIAGLLLIFLVLFLGPGLIHWFRLLGKVCKSPGRI